MRLRTIPAGFAFALALSASTLVAQTSRVTFGACDAVQTSNDTSAIERTNCALAYPYTSDAAVTVAFPLHLPSGSTITNVTLSYWDEVDGEPLAGVYRYRGGTLELVAELPVDPFSGGFQTIVWALPPNQVDNDYAYMLMFILKRLGSSYQGIELVSVDYKLNVSPAPPTATFNDVPTSHPFFQFVEALSASGITAGCGTGIFCPDQPLTRGQMAVFLSKALGLHFPN